MQDVPNQRAVGEDGSRPDVSSERRPNPKVLTPEQVAHYNREGDITRLPVFRTNDVKHLIHASRAIGEAGIGCVEYTLTMPDALGLIRKARKE